MRIIVHLTDAAREYAYDRASCFSRNTARPGQPSLRRSLAPTFRLEFLSLRAGVPTNPARRSFCSTCAGRLIVRSPPLYPLLAPTCAAPNDVKQGDCLAIALKIYQRSPIPKERLRVDSWI